MLQEAVMVAHAGRFDIAAVIIVCFADTTAPSHSAALLPLWLQIQDMLR